MAFRHTLTGLLLAALAAAPFGCGGDDDGGGADAGSADAGAEVAPPTSSDVAPEPASAAAGEQKAEQPR